jgi:hypothetical protein
MTKIKHVYNDELEYVLIRMDDEEFFEWLQTNEIIYNQSFEQAIKLSRGENDISED